MPFYVDNPQGILFWWVSWIFYVLNLQNPKFYPVQNSFKRIKKLKKPGNRLCYIPRNFKHTNILSENSLKEQGLMLNLIQHSKNLHIVGIQSISPKKKSKKNPTKISKMIRDTICILSEIFSKNPIKISLKQTGSQGMFSYHLSFSGEFRTHEKSEGK